jgi:hypothetical protein
MAIQLRQVECLQCGHRRAVRKDEPRTALDECPRCQYVGWAATAELSDRTRSMLRKRPPERRRLRAV